MFVVRIVGIVCCLMAFVVPSQVSAQQGEISHTETRYVIYLKDGRIIRGIILEKTDETLSVRTGSDRVISLSIDQVARLEKEQLSRRIDNKRKSPYVAMGLSALLPGSGQFYNGQYGKGGIQLVIYGIGWGLVLTGRETVTETEERYDLLPDGTQHYSLSSSTEYGFTDTGYIGLGLLAGTWLWSLIDAPISAKNINKKDEYGHLLKLGDDRVTLGIDPVIQHNGLGTLLTVHF